jgi:hypothetical protein
MRDRAEQLGGTLSAGRDGADRDGAEWRVDALIPLEAT